MLFEAPTNPMLQVPDLAAITALAKRHDVVTVLDNTFAGLHNHGRYEVDYFVHSLTKYANGHGDAMGGIVIGEQQAHPRDQAARREHGRRARPRRRVPDRARAQDLLLALRAALGERARDRGVAREAQGSHEGVLPGAARAIRATRSRASRWRTSAACSTFDLDADKDRTWAFIDALELFTTTASLGSTESLVRPVKLYLGSDLSAEEHARAQIKDSTVRLAVGIEHVDDLIADLDQALRKMFG